MNLVLSDLRYPVTTLGPGRRLAVWLQGCSLGCAGCMARHTWAPEQGTTVAVDDVVSAAARLADQLDGVTISGGEPFEQPEALKALVDALVRRREEDGTDWDILCYSGMHLDRLRADYPTILDCLDVLIPEPFLVQRPKGVAWQGSDNQPLVLLTPRAESRYREGLPVEQVSVQVFEDDHGFTVVGIPDRGDLARIEIELSARGIDVAAASWH